MILWRFARNGVKMIRVLPGPAAAAEPNSVRPQKVNPMIDYLTHYYSIDVVNDGGISAKSIFQHTLFSCQYPLSPVKPAVGRRLDANRGDQK